MNLAARTLFIFSVLWLCPCAAAPVPDLQRGRDTPQEALSAFISAIALGNYEAAYNLIAASTKNAGDPIAYNAPVDRASFSRELGGCEHCRADLSKKFQSKEFGAQRRGNPDRARIWVTFQKWDRDEALLVRENGKWFVADPIHLIR